MNDSIYFNGMYFIYFMILFVFYFAWLTVKLTEKITFVISYKGSLPLKISPVTLYSLYSLSTESAYICIYY